MARLKKGYLNTFAILIPLSSSKRMYSSSEMLLPSALSIIDLENFSCTKGWASISMMKDDDKWHLSMLNSSDTMCMRTCKNEPIIIGLWIANYFQPNPKTALNRRRHKACWEVHRLGLSNVFMHFGISGKICVCQKVSNGSGFPLSSFQKEPSKKTCQTHPTCFCKEGCFTSDFLGQNNPKSKHIVVRMDKSATEVFEAVQKLAVRVLSSLLITHSCSFIKLYLKQVRGVLCCVPLLFHSRVHLL